MSKLVDMVREIKGYLTVYLTLTLTLVLSLCLALIEGARQNAIFLETECVTDIGLNSILAEYHRELLEQYNLFAIDSSYGTALPQVGVTGKHLEGYIEKNVSRNDVFLDWLLYRDFCGMSLKEAEVTKALLMTDENGAVFRRRAAEAVWDDMNLDLYEDLKGWMETVESEHLTERDIAEEKRKLDEELESHDGEKIWISETEWETVDVENPTSWLESLRGEGVLSWAVDSSQLSDKSISLENLIESRAVAGSLNQGNMELEKFSEVEQVLERFFFQEYLIRYMGYYGAESEEDVLAYQIEYLVAGSESDRENLRVVIDSIFAVREVANLSYIVADQDNRMIAEGLAALLATAMGIPEVAEVLEWILLIGWSFAESVYDVKCIMRGGRIPLMKTSDTWHYNLDKALNFDMEVEDYSSEEEGLSYADYLRIFMFLQNEDELTMRAMNVVEADMRATPGNENFRLDGCVDSVEAVVKMESVYGYECEITRQKGYNTQ